MRIQLTNEITEIKRLSEAIDSFCDDTNIHATVRHNLKAISDEWISNVIMYGFNSREKQMDSKDVIIDVSIEVLPDTILLSVIDNSYAFDPTRIPVPDIEQNMKSNKIGGLGIYIIRSLAKSIKYNRGNGFNNFVVELEAK